jgi:hypothetical protein
LLEASAAECLLQLGALHDGHAAHLHGAPDHSGRVTPPICGNPVDGVSTLRQLRFSNYAGHFSKK